MQIKRLVVARKLLIIRSEMEYQYVECSDQFTILREDGLPQYTYNGPLYVHRHQQGIEAVIHLDIEEYLRGVVPAEVMAAWPMETLKSQSVAARTYAFYHLAYARKFASARSYDVDDTIAYQAYTGINHQHPRTDIAIQETTGQILTHESQVIQAYYHADSGGATVSAEHAFSEPAHYCKAKPEPYDQSKYSTTWSLRIPMSEVRQRLAKSGLHFEERDVESVVVQIGKTHQRARQLELNLRDSRKLTVSVGEMRKWRTFPSSLFTARIIMAPSSPEILIEGRGSGHGVGLNQRGAMILAAEYQWDYRQILRHYYTKVLLCTVQPSDGSEVPLCQPKIAG
jgi:stage II sporulation protein D